MGCSESQEPKKEQTKTEKKPEQKSREIDFGAAPAKSLLQQAIDKEPGAAKKLFHEMDNTGTGKLSLAKIEKDIKDNYSGFDHQPVLIRAMKLADREGNGDGFVEHKEFIGMVEFLGSYMEMYLLFEQADKGSDHKIGLEEFTRIVPKLGMDISDPAAEFKKADRDKGGQILFDEFCFWLANKKGDHKMLGSKDGLVGYKDSTGHHVGGH